MCALCGSAAVQMPSSALHLVLITTEGGRAFYETTGQSLTIAVKTCAVAAVVRGLLG